MHNNYYFLRQLNPALRTKLLGAKLTECFSQNKDELILGFSINRQIFYIKAHLMSNFCCLSFPKEFHRSKKNSIDLFEELIGKQVINIRQFNNERSFAIEFNESDHLLFKMHGNRSNIVLLRNDEVVTLFKKNLSNDNEIKLSSLDRNLNQSKEEFEKLNRDINRLFPTFGKLINTHFAHQYPYTEISWQNIIEVLDQLENPKYYVVVINGIPSLSLLPIGAIHSQFLDPIEAINEFFIYYQKVTQLDIEKKKHLSILSKKISQSENYIAKTELKLNSIKSRTNYEIVANIIMANLHKIQPYSKEISLLNFYDNQEIRIKLNKNLTPQKNAEDYYRKSKNQKIEIAKLEETLSHKKHDLSIAKSHFNKIESLSTIKEIRGYIIDNQLLNITKPEKIISKPYYSFNFEGYDIWVGKNAKNNDILTQKLTYKEDLWLHAKDVSGSHVVIKYQSGKPYPKYVIEVAAQLAAYYSKRKSDSLCPVIFTPKKFVRKPKGSPPGSVVVDKENVILVEPKKI